MPLSAGAGVRGEDARPGLSPDSSWFLTGGAFWIFSRISEKIFAGDFANNLSRPGFGGNFVLHCRNGFIPFRGILNRTHTSPNITPGVSRKSFLTRLGGLLVGIGFVPSLFAKARAAAPAAVAVDPALIRPESRAIPRRDGSY